MMDATDVRAELYEAVDYRGPFVSVRIDKDKPLMIHVSILQQALVFFKHRTKAHGDKKSTLYLELPFLESDTFKCYVTYLYSGNICCENSGAIKDDAKDEGPQDDDQVVQHEYKEICKFYLLSKKLKDPDAQNTAMNAMLARFNEKDADGFRHIPLASTVIEMYRHTEEGSPLRRIMVDMYGWGCKSGVFTDNAFFECPEFLRDVAAALFKDRDDDPAEIPTDVSCCDYHDHTVIDKCKTKKRKRNDDVEDSGSSESAASEGEGENRDALMENQKATIKRLQSRLANIQDASGSRDKIEKAP